MSQPLNRCVPVSVRVVSPRPGLLGNIYIHVGSGVAHLLTATACQDANYGALLQDACLAQFQADMEVLGETLWCDWGKTIGSYEELSDCTRHVAGLLHCFWPGAAVDKFFIAVHQHYFRNCPVSGRALRDPPSSILYTLIVVPILVALLVTALVVWRSKHPEGIV
uniref:Receptor activity-modifying protein 1 n=1 Tax=Camelus bactrianus TaxID=9837 RepID=A0A9W3HD65_CAMBA|nr:receptor activity-modifying protein 1 [Camelus bactrianus]